MTAYSNRDGDEVLKEDEQSHFRKLVGNINWLAMNTRPDLCSDAMQMACNPGKVQVKGIKRAGRILRNPKERGIEIQFSNPEVSKDATLMVCTDAMEEEEAMRLQGEEMSGTDERTTRLEVVGQTTDSKSLKEVYQIDNQSENKGTVDDTAVRRRSVDMNIYTSSQETSRHEHPQHRVGTSKISDSRPPNKARSLPQQVTQALMFGQVDTRFQLRCVSNEPGTIVPTKIFYSTTQQDSPHVWTDRHGVLILFGSKELGTSVWAKIFVFYPTTPRSQQVAGKVPAPTISMTINKGRVLSATTL